MSRSKGARGELEFAALLSEAVGTLVQRKLGAARDGGDDVVYGKFSFEVKRHKTLNVEAWIAQASENASASSMVPVVVFRKNNRPWRVCLNLPDFLALIAPQKKG